MPRSGYELSHVESEIHTEHKLAQSLKGMDYSTQEGTDGSENGIEQIDEGVENGLEDGEDTGEEGGYGGED